MFQPMNDFVLVERDKEPEVVQQGKIYVKDETTFVAPKSPRKKSDRATVRGVGDGRIVGGNLFPIDLVVGDRVLITKYGGTDVEVNGVEMVLVRCGEIYGKFNGNGNDSAT